MIFKELTSRCTKCIATKGLNTIHNKHELKYNSEMRTKGEGVTTTGHPVSTESYNHTMPSSGIAGL